MLGFNITWVVFIQNVYGISVLIPDLGILWFLSRLFNNLLLIIIITRPIGLFPCINESFEEAGSVFFFPAISVIDGVVVLVVVLVLN